MLFVTTFFSSMIIQWWSAQGLFPLDESLPIFPFYVLLKTSGQSIFSTVFWNSFFSSSPGSWLKWNSINPIKKMELPLALMFASSSSIPISQVILQLWSFKIYTHRHHTFLQWGESIAHLLIEPGISSFCNYCKWPPCWCKAPFFQHPLQLPLLL